MTRSLARQLRENQTQVEKRLWYRIRSRQIHGAKFRRQATIGRYIVDFACFEHQLIIELDGGQYASPSLREDERTAWLKSQGFSILRFWNNDIIENMDGVLQRIAEGLERQAFVGCTPHPSPLPQGERELS